MLEGCKDKRNPQKIVAQSCSAKLHLNEPALNEIDYGLWEGLSTEQITAKWPAEYEEWNDQAVWPTHIFNGSFSECRQ
jgi:broad specificity phosphatase PhoE